MIVPGARHAAPTESGGSSRTAHTTLDRVPTMTSMAQKFLAPCRRGPAPAIWGAIPGGLALPDENQALFSASSCLPFAVIS